MCEKCDEMQKRVAVASCKAATEAARAAIAKVMGMKIDDITEDNQQQIPMDREQAASVLGGLALAYAAFGKASGFPAELVVEGAMLHMAQVYQEEIGFKRVDGTEAAQILGHQSAALSPGGFGFLSGQRKPDTSVN